MSTFFAALVIIPFTVVITSLALVIVLGFGFGAAAIVAAVLAAVDIVIIRWPFIVGSSSPSWSSSLRRCRGCHE